MVKEKKDRRIRKTENQLRAGLAKLMKEKNIREITAVSYTHLYVRFASVYREFKDVNTFMDELKKILK